MSFLAGRDGLSDCEGGAWGGGRPWAGRGGGGEQLGLGGGLAVILEQEAYLLVVCVRYCRDIPVGGGAERRLSPEG